jgi:hypothetical protein
MKKKSTNSQSAFFNLRVLFGLFVMLTGVFLALLSLGTFSSVSAQNEVGTTRQEMTVNLAGVLAFTPPACVPGAEMFSDVPASNPFCPFIEEMARRGITGGCGGGKFCPGDPVTRQQMAVFVVKTLEAARGLFAVVTGNNGVVVRGRRVVSSARVGAGAYEVIFDRDVTGCAYIATIGNPAEFTPPAGSIVTALRAGTTNGVFVGTRDTAGVFADRNFHLHVICVD